MRPDRAVVIGHRIEACGTARDGPDPPSRKAVGLHQAIGGQRGAIGTGNAAEQGVAGIGADHLALALLAVEGNDIAAERLAPEGLVESFGKALGLAPQPCRMVMLAKHLGGAGDRALGGIDIGLDLDQRDRPLCQSAIGVEDRVIGVLPALIEQALVGCPVIFDEAVAVAIAGTVDPAERRQDVRPQPLERSMSPVRWK